MTDDLWIVVPNWDKFQHYKDRNPKWIKIYTSLAHHGPFQSLAPRHRGLLFDIWMLYALHNGQLPASPAYIAHQCGLPSEWELRQRREAGEWLVSDGGVAVERRVEDTVRARDLKALEQAEFIAFVASKPLASRARSRELETEKKELRASPAKPKPPEGAPRPSQNVLPADPFKAVAAQIRNGTITDPLDLDAEIRGYHLSDDLAAQLRDQLEAT